MSGGRREGDSCLGSHVHPWWIHVNVWQNQYSIVKQNKVKIKIKKKKSRDIALPTKVRLVKAMVFPVVLYGCESWTVKKAERRIIDAFELWCWRRLFFYFFLNFYFYFILLYNTVLVLPYIDMNPPRVYMHSQT